MPTRLNTAAARLRRRIKSASGLKNLQAIPGVGPTIARDLIALGIHSVSDLRKKNPEVLYEEHCIQKGLPVDRCLLYVFRCAVYYASTRRPQPDLLKWWNWKNRVLRNGKAECVQP